MFLITPQPLMNEYIYSVSNGFIYMVSSASVTGSQTGFGDTQADYQAYRWYEFENPQVIGFGINNAETFNQATQYAKGAIIGSAFIQDLTKNGTDKISDL
jgi:tryptophan synthase alpha chain